MRTGIIIFFFSLLITTSCSVEPVPIEYGKDACHFCKMNIVDQQHGAEIVTKKGKVYKYDAIECLISDLKSKDEATVALFLVNTYDAPKSLSDASKSTFLISEAIKSPMGANLTAFKNEASAKSIKEEKGGEIFNWEELKIKMSN